MADVQILPSYGGAYVSETIAGVAAGTIGADTIDTSRCSQFAVQVVAVTSAGSSTLQVQHTMDQTNGTPLWADIGAALPIVSGAILRFAIGTGPYGRIRLKVIDAANSVQVKFSVTGFNLQVVT